MSLNAIRYLDYTAELDAIRGLLFRFNGRLAGASSKEDRLLVESEFLTLLADIQKPYHRSTLDSGVQPDATEWRREIDNRDYRLRVLLGALQSLDQTAIQYHNVEQTTLLEIMGRFRRLLQKNSQLALWSAEDAKYVITEAFTNLDNIDTGATQNLTIVPSMGVCLLPITKRVTVPIQTIQIGTGSNGHPGNSNILSNATTGNPNGLLQNQVFQYERLDQGPNRLVLTLTLASEQIVNAIHLRPTAETSGFYLEDMTIDGPIRADLHNLVGELPDHYRHIEVVAEDNYWSLFFLPVMARQITLTLVQQTPYTVKVKRNQQEITRQRYGIGIQQLQVERVSFSDTGSLTSSEQSLPVPLYGVTGILAMYGGVDALSSGTLQCKSNLANWSPNLLQHSMLLSGTEDSLQWKLNITRNTSLFSSFQQLWNEDRIVEYDSLLRTISRNQSPVRMNLPQVPTNGQVIAIQPKLGRRGLKAEAVKIGTGDATTVSYTLPFTWPVQKSTEDIHVYVGNIEQTYNANTSTMTAGEFSFSDDFHDIVLGEAPALNTMVKIVLDEEMLVLTEQTDGYYHYFDFMVDPDPLTMRITQLSRQVKRKAMILQKGKAAHHLNAGTINESTIQLTSLNGTVYTAATSRVDAVSGTNKYWLDPANGNLFLSASIGDDVLKISFDYSDEQILTQKDWSIVYENSRPVGVRINKHAIEQYRVTDIVGGTVLPFRNAVRHTFVPRNDTIVATNTTKTLTYPNVIVGSVMVDADLLGGKTPIEIPYIDGHSEFLGLIDMQHEATTALTPTSNVVIFTLAAGNAVYRELGIRFSDTITFATLVTTAVLVNSSGKYHVDANGVVTVWTGTASLPADIEMSYYYRDPDFDATDKFSVDYSRGIVHSFRTMTPTSQITYLAPLCKIAYDIGAVVPMTLSGTNVIVRTEDINPQNNLLKLVWQMTDNQTGSGTLAEYYSPIVDLVALRCT